MSGEVRRVSLKNVSNNNNNINSDKKSKNDSKATPKETKSKRFVLSLNSGTDECNEFSFNDLLKSLEEKNGGEANGANSDSDLSGDEQHLRNLEKHFQLKYGPKKRKLMEDHIDKGLGYDETDPFIDNEEAYDELVPSTLTTKYGGFYINCGELEFRPLSPEADNNVEEEDNDDDDEDNIKPVLKRKKKLKFISEKRRRSSAELMPKSVKNKTPNANKTVAQMLQHKKTTKAIASDNSDDIEEIELIDSDSNKEAAVVSTSYHEIIESVVKGEDQPNGEKKKKPSNGSLETKETEDSKRNENSLLAVNTNPLQSVKLPEGLPQDLIALIDKIKNLAKASNDGKRNFFTNDVNKLLFDVELKCRSLPQNCKTQVYAHLATRLPCTKQTLISRVKKASMESFDYELNTAIVNIQVLVKALTPMVFKNYQKLMDEAKELDEHNKQKGIHAEVKVPRKVFVFTIDLRRQLNDAITAKINLYDQIGAKSQSMSLKDYLYDFLDTKIKPIFPKGWITSEVLKRKVKWIKQILPPESTQTSAHPSLQSSHQSSPQTQTTNHIQSQTTHQSLSHEKVIKSQPLVSEKSNKTDRTDSEYKSLLNPNIKTIQNLYQSMTSKVNDNLSEGLGIRVIPNSKEIKNILNSSDNMSATNITTNTTIQSIDLTTKARSSPKPLNTTTARLSPINLKTSANTSALKSDAIKCNSSSPSPTASPLAMNSILNSSKTTDKSSEKLSREECLLKVIERSLGDYPNSYSNSERNTKTNHKTLPQNSLLFNEMFAKSFNNSSQKESKKSEICIEITSSPSEPYQSSKGQQSTHHSSNASKQQIQSQSQSHSSSLQLSQNSQQLQQQKTCSQSQTKSMNKALYSMSTISSSTSSSNQSFMRSSELPKKRYNSSSALIQSSNTQKEDDLRQNSSSKLDQMLLQSPINAMHRTVSRDTSLSITPIVSNKSSDNSINTTKYNSISSSRHSNSSNVITSTTPALSSSSTANMNDPHVMSAYLQYLGQMQSMGQMPNPLRFLDAPIYQTPQTTAHLFYPYTTTTTSNTTSNRTTVHKDK